LNIYFLVEGGETEPKVYPQWISHLVPKLSRVVSAHEACVNNYYLMSGMGSPRLLTNEFANSVAEINELGNYNYLVLVIDADDMTAQDKIEEIKQFIENNNIVLNSNCHLHIIAQKYCIETWFLGNQKVYTKILGKQTEFYNYAKFYDVSQQDPELMNKPEFFEKSVSIYHEIYLRKMLAEKNIRFSKSKPREVGEKHYLEQLQKRVKETSHLSSLKSFFNFCESI
jgi:hypothetical protein